MRNLIAIEAALVLVLIAVLQIVSSLHFLSPLGFFYAVFAFVFVLYGVYPLYMNRRLTRYYWDRTKRHRLAVLGLGFIFLIVLVAIFGPLLTQDPTAANFNEKNQPPLGFSVKSSVYDTSTNDFTTRDVP